MAARLVIKFGWRRRQAVHLLQSEREGSQRRERQRGASGGVDVRWRRRRRSCVTIANVNLHGKEGKSENGPSEMPKRFFMDS